MERLVLKKKRVKASTVILTIVSVFVAIFCSLPFIYMILMSVMPTSADIFSWPPKLFTANPSFANFNMAFKAIDMGKLILNTLLLMVGSVGIGMCASVLIAYGFARFKCKANSILFTVLLSTMMIPWVVTMIPGYVEFDILGWIGTMLPLIIPWIGGSAFNIFMLKQFIEGVPKELDEAGKIDGCNSFTILVRIIVPQLGPAMATVFLFSFMNTWNDYLGPSIYLSDPSLYNLSLGLKGFFDAYGGADWHLVMAASVMFSLPLLILLSFCQNAFVRGIVTSGIK